MIQQLADVGRVQGVLAVTIDAAIFAALHSPYEREPHGLVTFWADRGLRGIHGTECNSPKYDL